MKFNKLCKKMTLENIFYIVLLIILSFFVVRKLLDCIKNREEFSDSNTAVPEGNDINMVLFYAEWCPHCQKIKPLWNKLTNKMNGKEVNNRKVNIVMVHCPDEEEVCSANKISGYPTIKCISNKKSKEFEGTRTLEGLTNFIKDFVSSL